MHSSRLSCHGQHLQIWGFTSRSFAFCLHVSQNVRLNLLNHTKLSCFFHLAIGQRIVRTVALAMSIFKRKSILLQEQIVDLFKRQALGLGEQEVYHRYKRKILFKLVCPVREGGITYASHEYKVRFPSNVSDHRWRHHDNYEDLFNDELSGQFFSAKRHRTQSQLFITANEVPCALTLRGRISAL